MPAYNVFALRRSGHHAIIDWMIDCLRVDGQSVGVVNNIFEYGPNPSDKIRNLTLSECIHHSGGASIIVANYEDVFFGDRYRNHAYSEMVQQNSADIVDVVVIRDICNLAASRIRRVETSKPELGWRPLREIEEIWKEHLQLPPSKPRIVKILYNNWLESEPYRFKTATALHFKTCRKLSNEVASVGGGSSFDSFRFRGEASAMNLTRRWEDLSVAHLPAYATFLRSLSEWSRERNMTLFGIDFGHVYDSVIGRM